jgi:pimeloyl-ACP methyl ester carboxylesterase
MGYCEYIRGLIRSIHEARRLTSLCRNILLVGSRVSRCTAGLAGLLFSITVFATIPTAESPKHKVRIEGTGTATVILEAGLGDTLEVWNEVQPLIAENCARTLAYNRAGYLGSEPAQGRRDSATIVAELREELRNHGIKPPYVLVGHSIGGLYMQYFARNYPDEIEGLVLVDSTHWNQSLRLDPDSSGPWTKRRQVTLFMPWIVRREFTDSGEAGVQVHQSPHVRYVPTIVLSSTRAPLGETPASRALAASMQEEIAKDFPLAKHVRVDGSGHYIQRDQPQTVIDAARTLAGCAPLVAKIQRESHERPN